jgi:hypothetical protein
VLHGVFFSGQAARGGDFFSTGREAASLYFDETKTGNLNPSVNGTNRSPVNCSSQQVPGTGIIKHCDFNFLTEQVIILSPQFSHSHMFVSTGWPELTACSKHIHYLKLLHTPRDTDLQPKQGKKQSSSRDTNLIASVCHYTS